MTHPDNFRSGKSQFLKHYGNQGSRIMVGIDNIIVTIFQDLQETPAQKINSHKVYGYVVEYLARSKAA